MVHAHSKFSGGFALAAALLLLSSGQLFGQQDPPSRVARLNYINGNVSMEPAGVDDWAPADLNRPFTIGDYLYADQGAEAELHLDDAVLRMGSQTSFGFLNLNDQAVQLKLSEGDMYIRLHDFGSGQVFEVDTPNAAVTLLGNGIYRFRVDSNGNMTFVVVRQGQAQITGGGQAFILDANNSATLNGTDQLSYDVELAPQPDEFDQWSQERDAHEAQAESARYLPPTVIGSEDLDDYGSWQNSGEYGAVWYPRDVDSGWAPYHYGHWAWIDPWGWTWIDSQPWGFAPFHYGRWAYIGNRWGWCPGPMAGSRGSAFRPYYAPAMVAWFGGAHWFAGGGPSLGWVPLGWGEVYTPSYRCSPRYFSNVNTYNTRVVNTVNITNVYNTVYVNKTVYNQQFVNARAPNAVMAMPQAAFVSGRPVRQAATPVRQTDLARVQSAAVIAPPVAPTRQSVLASASTRPAAKPAPQVIQRPVVARNRPPAAPASFAAQQPSLQQHPGQVANQQPAPAVRPVAANVRQAPPATPITVKPGERHGNTAAAARPAPAAAPAPSAPVQAQNGRPAQPNAPGRTQPYAQPVEPSRAPAQAPAAAAHGVPPNLRQQTAPQNTPPPDNRRYNQPAQPAAQPGYPNRPSQPTPQAAQPGYPNRPAQPAQQAAQPGYPNRPAQPAQPGYPNRPAQPAQQAGQPGYPNRPSQPAQAQQSRPVAPARTAEPPSPQMQERTPAAQERPPAPSARQPQVEERTQPAPERVAPPERQAPPAPPRTQPAPERPEPQVQERTQPAPERPAPPAREPQTQERPQPAPERAAPPAREPAPPQERSQPNRQETKPEAAPHSQPNKPDHDHPNDDKKQ